jgi:hypothetical protein
LSVPVTTRPFSSVRRWELPPSGALRLGRGLCISKGLAMNVAIVFLASLAIGQTAREKAMLEYKPSQLESVSNPHYTPRAGDEAVLWTNDFDNDRYDDVIGTMSDRIFDGWAKKIKEGKPLQSKVPALKKALELNKGGLRGSMFDLHDDFDGLYTIAGGTKVRVLEVAKVPYGEAQYSLARTKVLVMDQKLKSNVMFVSMMCVMHMIINTTKTAFYQSEVRRLKGTKIPPPKSIQEAYKPKVNDKAVLYFWLPERGHIPVLAAESRADYAEYFASTDRNDEDRFNRMLQDGSLVRLPSGSEVEILEFPFPVPGNEAPPALVRLISGPDAGDEWYVMRAAIVRFDEPKP